MSLFWKIIKQTAIGTWEELLYIIGMNFLVYLPLMLGVNLIFMGWAEQPLFLPLGVLCLLAFPPAVFGLFHTTDQISQGNAIKFSTFIEGARGSLKAAYIWGGINLVVAVILIANITFYLQMENGTVRMVAMFVFGVAVVWSVLQLLALTLYPRLIEPGFKLATKNAVALAGMQPGLLLAIIIVTAVIVLLGLFVPLIIALLSISLTALLYSTTTHELLQWVDKQQEDEQAN